MTTRQRKPRHGDGSVWLIADRLSDEFDCYWYSGTHEIDLVEQTCAATAARAVTWGRVRSPRVRIRTRDGQSQWAGTDPRPDTFTMTWNDSDLTGSATAPIPTVERS